MLPGQIAKLKILVCEAIEIIFEDTIDISDGSEGCELPSPELEIESPFATPPELEIATPIVQPTPLPEVVQASVPVAQNYPVMAPTPEMTQAVEKLTTGLDNRGIKWDERIHASSQAIMKNGEWRNKRGVNKDLLAQVEAELIGGAVVASVAAEPIPAPPAPTIATPPIPTTTAMTPTIPQAIEPALLTPVADQPPVTHPTYTNESPIPTSNKQAHTLETFKGNIVNVLANLVKDQKITQEYVEALKVHFEVAELWQVFGDESKVEELFVNFCNMGLITNVE